MWYHVAAVCTYDERDYTQKLMYYRNAEPLYDNKKGGNKWPRVVNLMKRIGFIGNCKKGNEPFGIVADLRIYPYGLRIEEL